ncbi:CubicO group peptidase (beta-lactamase class C family) [Amycolatopsis sulphurea]|uniref:Beta-lactamase n=1 Tax=Amycolatopsis sulphurea TaxID=76022 RepID=A0A2A9G4I7_9PSEU|nr:serine hydrolase domain-containing protein [Amycolatopsis sulphurea]PFG57549.1 CubicO group peptidase (beta-lactamase class C family) [Amycolatopsis sulphurea]
MTIDTLVADIERQIGEYLTDCPEATFSLGLTVRGQRVLRGFRTPGAELAPVPEPDSIYEIGSISKTFSNTVLAVLEDQGRLSIDDPIGKHLPFLNLAPDVAAITLKQLATHSSGLVSTGDIHLYYQQTELRGELPPFGTYTHYLRYRKEDLYSDLETAKFAHPAGTGFLYSVMGMGTLGHICELVGGKPYEQLLRELVLEPLGLTDTFYTITLDQLQRMQVAFDAEGQPLPNWYHDVMMSQGGLRSTANDLLGFAEAQIRATTENEDTVLARAMRRTRQPYFSAHYEDGPDFPIIGSNWKGQVVQGLAWRGFTDRPASWWHSGTTLFYHSGLAIDTEARTGLVMLTTNRRTMTVISQLNELFLTWFERACLLPES